MLNKEKDNHYSQRQSWDKILIVCAIHEANLLEINPFFVQRISSSRNNQSYSLKGADWVGENMIEGAKQTLEKLVYFKVVQLPMKQSK